MFSPGSVFACTCFLSFLGLAAGMRLLEGIIHCPVLLRLCPVSALLLQGR